MEFPALHHIDDAIRTEVDGNLGPFPTDHVLTIDAGRALFEARYVAPREMVADRALDYIRIDPDAEDLMPTELVARFRECVVLEAIRIAREPLEYEFTKILRTYYRSLTATFGVDDEHADALLLAFVDSPEPDRLGAILALEHTPGFEWLSPLIDIAPRPKALTEPLQAIANVNRHVLTPENRGKRKRTRPGSWRDREFFNPF